ncbi:MAG: hypothetical protein K2J88_00930 [Oscillospiraceae bacterium]|nr:hypothetical protein [Oscillospiraceae bacterium]
MSLTTILLFGLAILGFVLLLMIVISSSRTMFGDKITDNDEDEEEYENEEDNNKQEKQVTPKENHSNFKTETACVVFKFDERERLLDEYQHSSIHNEKYGLILETPNGEKFRLACSKTAHKQMPYRETGTFTFRDNKLIKFDSEKHTISDEYTLT